MKNIEKDLIKNNINLFECHKDEIWKAVDGLDGYEISSCGRLRSVDRIVKTKRGIKYFYKGTLKKVTLSPAGYKRTLIRGKNFTIHRLVLTTFCGKRKEKQVCRHLDNDCLNNHISNLKWGSQKENMDDKRAHGTYQIGDLASNNKLKMKDVEKIFELKKTNISDQKIASMFGVARSTITAVRIGQNWKQALMNKNNHV